jgi:thiol-disulfide isomerase/thioredoxin
VNFKGILKDRQFIVGFAVAFFVVFIIRVAPSFFSTPNQEKDSPEKLTLLDLNFVARSVLRTVKDYDLTVYEITKSGVETRNKKLSDFASRGFVMHFWATWCGPCVSELPDFNKFTIKNNVPHITIVSENLSPEKVKRFLKELNINEMIVCVDKNQEISSDFQVSAMPTTFFMNSKMQEIGQIQGVVSWADAESEKLLLRALKG